MLIRAGGTGPDDSLLEMRRKGGQTRHETFMWTATLGSGTLNMAGSK